MKKLDQEITLIKTTGYVYYIKWIATFLVLIAVACRSVDEIPKIYDVVFSLLGTFGWLYVGLAWKDRALIVLNAVITFMLFTALLRYMF
jgi:hypothetical protein